MITIGCDPGKSFGLAMLGTTSLMYVYQGDAEQGLRALHNILVFQTEIAAHKPNYPIAVAIEQFTITPGTGRRPGASQTARLAGRAVEVARSFPSALVALQSPADAARAWPSPLLRRLGLWVSPGLIRGTDPGAKDADDANSALRHALLWLQRNRPEMIQEMMRGVDIV